MRCISIVRSLYIIIIIIIIIIISRPDVQMMMMMMMMMMTELGTGQFLRPAQICASF